MGDRIPIALNLNENCLVSKIYPVFEVKDKNFLLPEYLYIFFKRKEFDRYARYHSWGSARETFNWDDMKKVKIYIPSIEKQDSIIELGNIILLNEKLLKKYDTMIEKICPTLLRKIN